MNFLKKNPNEGKSSYTTSMYETHTHTRYQEATYDCTTNTNTLETNESAFPIPVLPRSVFCPRGSNNRSCDPSMCPVATVLSSIYEESRSPSSRESIETSISIRRDDFPISRFPYRPSAVHIVNPCAVRTGMLRSAPNRAASGIKI